MADAGARTHLACSASSRTDFSRSSITNDRYSNDQKGASHPPHGNTVKYEVRISLSVTPYGVITLQRKMVPQRLISKRTATKFAVTSSQLAIFDWQVPLHRTSNNIRAVATAASPWRAPWRPPLAPTCCASPSAKRTLIILVYAVEFGDLTKNVRAQPVTKEKIKKIHFMR